MDWPAGRLRLIFVVAEALLTLTLDAPPGTPPDGNFDVARVELTTSGGDLLLVGYDDAGSPLGTVALWMGDDGALHLESDYSDGYASTIVQDGRDRTKATLTATVLERRAQLMVDQIDSGPQEGALGCAVSTTVEIRRNLTASRSPPQPPRRPKLGVETAITVERRAVRKAEGQVDSLAFQGVRPVELISTTMGGEIAR